MAERVRETFTPSNWREEVETYYRQRHSVWFVIALMIVMAAFWQRPQAWIAFFLVLAGYSALALVRMGVVCGLSFAAWFLAADQKWLVHHDTTARVVGLWCISTLFLLVVWKADGVHRLRDRRASDADVG